MNILSRKKIVILGMMSRMPVAGVIWQTMHYMVGFQRLGYDAYYVEAHGCTPRAMMRHQDGRSAAFIDGVLRRFDLGGQWAYHALNGDGRCYGMSEGQLRHLYSSADLIINLHGGTVPLPEHYATGRLIYLETDPVERQIDLHNQLQSTIDFLAPHRAFFTFGENYGNADCRLPVSDRFHFRPTRQPVMMDFWKNTAPPRDVFTTIGNWRQDLRPVKLNGEVYHWSKHYEFLKFLDLPCRTGQAFELALSSYDEADQRLLEERGWQVRPAKSFSYDVDAYREYIHMSRGEFTVAKDQNIRLRTGWFSDRSATYLAAGRPVITQETGFSNLFPTGAGLFGFSTLDEAAAAVESINADYERASRAATAVASEWFNYEMVLKQLLAEVGV